MAVIYMDVEMHQWFVIHQCERPASVLIIMIFTIVFWVTRVTLKRTW